MLEIRNKRHKADSLAARAREIVCLTDQNIKLFYKSSFIHSIQILNTSFICTMIIHADLYTITYDKS